jgi:hypothetical protein
MLSILMIGIINIYANKVPNVVFEFYIEEVMSQILD